MNIVGRILKLQICERVGREVGKQATKADLPRGEANYHRVCRPNKISCCQGEEVSFFFLPRSVDIDRRWQQKKKFRENLLLDQRSNSQPNKISRQRVMPSPKRRLSLT